MKITSAALLSPLACVSTSFAFLNALEADAAARLKNILSPDAAVYFPGSDTFDDATERWQNWASPRFLAAVEVATEKDVRFANKHHRPFLAVSGGHGMVGSLGNFNYGIEIWIRKLNTINIAEDGKSARLGGGLLSKEVTDALWAKGMQTTTGLCECVGMMGALLGGGHGILQGGYGLIADNLVEAHVVLPDGSRTTASVASNPDLYWAMKGAGHNFAVITSYTIKIYNVPANNSWVIESYIYTEDKLEELLELTNAFTEEGEQPVKFLNWAYYVSLPDVDPDHPVIQYKLLYKGSTAQASHYTSGYRALSPVSITSDTVSYPDLPVINGNSNADIGCQHGYSVLQYPISLHQYNVTAHRKAFDIFADYTRRYPGLNASFFMNEGYSLKGVKGVPAESTAYPDQDGNLLIAPVMIFFDPAEEDHADEAGKAIWEVLLEGSRTPNLDAYVNYVSKGESVQDIYGHEPWRLEKLRGLKRKYDPANTFRYFAPIW
ncbi:FAD-dependent oxygenase [Clathrospora elynae]|uniref:FAD-dependent oxygenase n=1 Tax=Clathrospora elynae TaxID=706981 RepID=A0A6A5SEA6_9PLEO|nr:FAD-dependent oxygenase [Clathrospora elynae]